MAVMKQKNASMDSKFAFRLNTYRYSLKNSKKQFQNIHPKKNYLKYWFTLALIVFE